MRRLSRKYRYLHMWNSVSGAWLGDVTEAGRLLLLVVGLAQQHASPHEAITESETTSLVIPNVRSLEAYS